MKKLLFAMIVLILGFSFATPASTAATIPKGGLSPDEGLILTYSPSFTKPAKETFHVAKDEAFTYLYNKKSPRYPELPNLVYYEDDSGMTAGVGHSDIVFVSAPYPMKQGSFFIQSDHFDDYKVLVENTSKTVKTKAGTFKNTVILKYPNGSRLYLVKGIGIIKSTNAAGKVKTELVSVRAGK